MKYLHTMIRVADLGKTIHFYTEGLGFQIVKRQDHDKDRFTLVFLRSGLSPTPEYEPLLELTYNWDTKSYERGNGYGHMAYEVKSIDDIQKRLKQHGYDLSWGPGQTPNGKTKMAFIDDPDGYEIELLEI